jgi:Na+-driven multidrug efflux pump
LAPAFFYTLVHGMGLGLDGAAIAFILCQVSSGWIMDGWQNT